jgi:hypothetical protein
MNTDTHIHTDMDTHEHRHAKRETHTDTQTHRETDTHRHTHTETHRHEETQTDTVTAAWPHGRCVGFAAGVRSSAAVSASCAVGAVRVLVPVGCWPSRHHRGETSTPLY